jgi:hypothetical protein
VKVREKSKKPQKPQGAILSVPKTTTTFLEYL